MKLLAIFDILNWVKVKSCAPIFCEVQIIVFCARVFQLVKRVSNQEKSRIIIFPYPRFEEFNELYFQRKSLFLKLSAAARRKMHQLASRQRFCSHLFTVLDASETEIVMCTNESPTLFY
jgi:hypothetical protein